MTFVVIGALRVKTGLLLYVVLILYLFPALDVVWLSTYTFLVAYISKGADCTDQPQVVLINGGVSVRTQVEPLFSHSQQLSSISS